MGSISKHDDIRTPLRSRQVRTNRGPEPRTRVGWALGVVDNPKSPRSDRLQANVTLRRERKRIIRMPYDGRSSVDRLVLELQHLYR